jgi:hypothetical protein
MMRRFFAIVLPLVAVCVVIAPDVSRADFAHLTFTSNPGDFIGGGQTVNLTYDSTAGATVASSILSGRMVNGQPGFLEFVIDQNVMGTNTFSTLAFATDRLPLPFQVGSYANAERAAFADPGFAGLDVSFQNRGSNTLTGSFTVNSVAFYLDSTSTVQIASLDVNFVQHSEGATPALTGHFVFQSSAVPEPSSLVLLGFGAAGLAWRRSRRPR